MQPDFSLVKLGFCPPKKLFQTKISYLQSLLTFKTELGGWNNHNSFICVCDKFTKVLINVYI